jgi:hypothetical protein
MSDDFKAALRETMAEMSGGSDGGNDAGGTGAPAAGSEAQDAAESGAEAGAGGADGLGEPAVDSGRGATDDSASARSRDEKGRFATKAKETPGASPAVETKTGKPSVASATGKAEPPGGVRQPDPGQSAVEKPPVSPAPEFKAPQSWKQGAREKLAKADPEVQQEVIRREQHIEAFAREVAPDRKLAGDVRQVLAPFEPMLRAQGADPVRTIGSLMQTSMALQTAPPHQVAEMMATIITQFGVGRFGEQFIDQVSNALNGKPVQAGAHQAQHADPAMFAQQAWQHFEKMNQERESQRARVEAVRDVEKFGGEREFFGQVRRRMGALLTADVELSLEDAYNQACWADPEVRKTLQQREATEQAKAKQASTQQELAKARHAASSVKSQPAAQVAGKSPDNFKEALRAEFRAAEASQ